MRIDMTVDEWLDMTRKPGDRTTVLNVRAGVESREKLDEMVDYARKCANVDPEQTQVTSSEQTTTGRILNIIYDVTRLDFTDQGYLQKCIADGRVKSLDGVEQFLNKILVEDKDGR